MNSRLIFILGILITIIFLGSISFPPEEGMFPLSDIHKLNLNEAGLKISVDEVYNPNGISIIDGLVKIGGCSGSFISDKGLILTNHHCVFGSVQKVSTLENNYLENGFLASTSEQEIPTDLTCRITESYEDVSDKILKSVENTDDISKRSELIEKKIKEIIKEEEKKDKTIKAEISEMFTGQSYILFRYKTINDVRLVYVPPRNIGEFGGESDNWVWPRHTGDFSFVRAYMAPDGSPAKYSQQNIPFKPKRFIKVNPDGVQENDFIFIMGYPGRTFKNYPANYLVYQQKFQLPYISELYRWLINLYETEGEKDPAFALKISS
ncbi:MAG TPA: S46 family peptidase, partial [Ignavibacteriaceae bacterium]|nr:S46 family peptidase [Ignavibacteriaceae bacterium]